MVLGNLIGGFIVILVGVTLIPSLADQVETAKFGDNLSSASNVTGAAATLIDLSTRQVGWWVTKDGLDTVVPLDGYPDQDRANIKHTTFPIVTNYGAEFGSGIQDVYQNCYIPSEGPDGFGGNCNTTDLEPYCCSGVAMDQTTWQASACFTGF